MVIGKDFSVKNAISSHPEGCCSHLTSLPWSLVLGCPGKRQLRPCSFYCSVIFVTWRSLTPCVPAQKKSKNQGAVIKMVLLKTGYGRAKDSNAHLNIQRGLLLRVSLESEVLGRAEVGQSSWCQVWQDGSRASNTCFQFPVAKKRFWLRMQMPVLKWYLALWSSMSDLQRAKTSGWLHHALLIQDSYQSPFFISKNFFSLPLLQTGLVTCFPSIFMVEEQ